MKRATVRTSHGNPRLIAACVSPDNTQEMHTTVEAGMVVTTIEREATGGLQSSLDDYIVNLQVAETIDATARNETLTNDDTTTYRP